LDLIQLIVASVANADVWITTANIW
jgi:hypothetical protein